MLLVLLFTIGVCSSLNACNTCCMHAVAGLISVILSYTASMGLCFYLGLYRTTLTSHEIFPVVVYCRTLHKLFKIIGFAYNDLVSLTSFLALAIGVDDTFILLSAWRSSAHLSMQTPVPVSLFNFFKTFILKLFCQLAEGQIWVYI